MKAKYFTKNFCILIALVMTAMMIASCSTNGGRTEATQTESGASTTTSKEIPTIDYMIPFEPGYELTSDSKAIVYWGEKTGVKFNIISPPRDNYKDKVNIALVSKDLPDMIHFFQDAITFKQYGSSLFVPIDEHIQQGKLSNFKKWFDMYQTELDIMRSPDGHIYGFPQFSDYTWINSVIWAREDLLKKSGYDANSVKTLEDLKKALKGIKDNAGHDYIMVNRHGVSYFFGYTMPFFGITQDVYYDDDPGGSNRYVFAPELPRFKTYVEFCKYLYDNKILHPDFETMTDNELDAAYANMQICFAFDAPNGWTDYDNRTVPELPDEAFAAVILPPEIDGVRYAVRNSSPVNIGWRWPVVISKSSKNIEDCIRAMDFVYSDEGRYDLLYGPRAEWWDFDESYPGGIKFNIDVALKEKIIFPQLSSYLRQQGKKLEDVFPDGAKELLNFGYGWYLSGVIPFEDRTGAVQRIPGEEYYVTMTKDAIDLYVNNKLVKDPEPPVQFTDEEYEEVVRLRTAIQTYVEENTLLFINGQKPLSEYDKFIEGLKRLNSARLVELYNIALSRKS